MPTSSRSLTYAGDTTISESKIVTFKLNARLDLSWQATTKSLCPLGTELLLQVLSESTWTVAVRVIRGDEGVGDIPGVQGGSRGGLKIVHNRLD